MLEDTSKNASSVPVDASIKTKKIKQTDKKNSSSTNRKFWSKVLADLQRLGKSLMFPIAVLPFAALLNRFGTLAMDLNPIVDNVKNAGYWIGFVIQTPGAIVFSNIALLFAIGTGFGLAKDNRGEAALVSTVLFFALTGFLNKGGLPELLYKNVLTYTDVSGNKWSQLFYVKSFTYNAVTGDFDVTGGNYILDIGVLGGIVAGCLSAYSYNKFKDIKLPQALSFFGGRRFVPMVVLTFSIPLAFMFATIWPWIQYALVIVGQTISSGDAWSIPGAFIYALINRLVQPFGLHHIINTFLWFQLPIQGNLIDVNGHIVLTKEVFEWWDLTGVDPSVIPHLTELKNAIEAGYDLSQFNGGSYADIQIYYDQVIELFNKSAQAAGVKDIAGDTSFINGTNWMHYFSFNADKAALSDGTIIPMADGMYVVNGDINAFQRGLLSGTFQTGYFPMYWGGLTAASAAMIMAAKKENRKQVAAFLIGVAVVAALTGIDEPIVFSFIFVGPILWGYNAVFTAIFAAIAVSMHMHIGFGFSGGFIDYIISFANSWGMSKYEGMVNGSVYGVTSNPLWMLVLAVAMAPIYYFSFYFTIKKLDIKTPGREDDGADNIPTTESNNKSLDKQKTGKKDYTHMAEEIIRIVGAKNIELVENCATRLRLTVKNNSELTVEPFKELGVFGVRKLGINGFQIIIGTDVEFVAEKIKEQLNNMVDNGLLI